MNAEAFKRIAASTAGTPTLLVTESEGLSRKGACINFVLVDDHLKLEINKKAILKAEASTLLPSC